MNLNAIRNGDLAALKRYLNTNHINAPMDDGYTPLTAASYTGKLPIIDFLLDSGAAIDRGSSDGTPLGWACFMGRIRVVKRLLNAGANVDVVDAIEMFPLASAANDGHFKVVRLLLDAGADINKVDRRGNTALHHACFCPKKSGLETFRLLLERGAATNIRNHDDMTACLVARKQNWLWSSQMVELFQTAVANR